MNRWQVLGVFFVLLGAALLVALSGFIVQFIVTLLKVAAVFVGVILVLGGFFLIFGGRLFRRTRARWSGPAEIL